MNNAIEELVIFTGEAILTVAKIVLFIASIPLVFWYLYERKKIEEKLRKLGQWPY